MQKILWHTLLLITIGIRSLWAIEGAVEAQLVSEVESIQPGEPFRVGLYFKIAPGWHTYSENPGESGYPTSLTWDLPAGFEAGPIKWPQAESFDYEGIQGSGYTKKALHTVTITPLQNLKINETITLQAKAAWLACNVLCVPGEADLSLTLPVKAGPPALNPIWEQEFKDAQASLAPATFHNTEINQALPSTTLSRALLLAFIGGLILNLMPCVFPILSLKILGFVQQAGEHPWKIRFHGIVFTLGVLLSFMALSGLLLLLRAGGEGLGWGFQLQSPLFIAFLSILLLLVALNFAGVFEFGTSLMSTSSRFGQQSGIAGTFCSGILATVLATPCTAPFMGTALGFALAQPAMDSLKIFALLGLGMASPYLILSFIPGLLRFLPRPGAWMETFKQAMAFPMLATIIWLLWVFAQQTHLNAMAKFLIALLLIAIAAWVYGRFTAFGAATHTKRLGLICTTLFLLTGGIVAYSASQATPSHDSAGTHEATSLAWEPFSPERLESLRAAKQPVYIDFTAAWCLTCQANKKNIFRSNTVIQSFKDKNVVLMKADWTRKDPVITQALEQYGRSGVPTNVLYLPEPNVAPILLPELLTPSIVLEALSALNAQEAQPLAMQRKL